jgi:hypothetical protein
MKHGVLKELLHFLSMIAYMFALLELRYSFCLSIKNKVRKRSKNDER